MHRKVYIFCILTCLFFSLNLKSQPPITLAQLDQITKLKKDKEKTTKTEAAPDETPSVLNWQMVFILVAIAIITFFTLLYKRSLDFRQLLRTAKSIILSKPKIKNYIFLCKEIIRFIHERLRHDPWAVYQLKKSNTEVIEISPITEITESRNIDKVTFMRRPSK